MGTQVATTNGKELATVSTAILDSFLFSNNTTLTEREKASFYSIAKAYNLDPFKREVYCIAYGDGDKRSLSIITGYEVYVKRAERTGLINGWKVEFFGRFEKKSVNKEFFKRDGSSYFKRVEEIVELERCYARITIHRKDQSMPFEHEVELCEYNQNNSMWTSKPVTMLKKVCIGQGFRLCFSDELAGMPYLAEELPSREPEYRDVTHEVHPPANATAEQAVKAMHDAGKRAQAPDESGRPAFMQFIQTAGIRIGFEKVIEVIVSCGYETPEDVTPADFRKIVNAIKDAEANVQ